MVCMEVLSIGYRHDSTRRPTNLVDAPPKALPARTSGLQNHGVVGDGVYLGIQPQERVRNGFAVGGVQRSEDLQGVKMNGCANVHV